MKIILKTLILLIVVLCILNTMVLANNVTTAAETNKNDIVEMKEEVSSKLDKYTEKYGSESYGLAAYILNFARIYSIPICFIGIIVGALNQYVLGTRRLDKKHKGYGMIMTFVTLLVICQVLPLIFTIVVMGWRD